VALGIHGENYRRLFKAVAKPRLLTVLRAAASTNIDVRAILTMPTDSVRQIDAFQMREKICCKRRHRVSLERRAHVGSEIDSAIGLLETNKRAASLSAICRRDDVVPEYAHYWFPEKTRKLYQLRRAFNAYRKQQKLEQAMRLADSLIRTQSAPRPILGKRAIEHRIAADAGVSKRVAIEALAAVLRCRCKKLDPSYGGHDDAAKPFSESSGFSGP